MKQLRTITEDEINERKVFIPVDPLRKKLIIFDLDETLIHCVGTQEECEGKNISKYVDLQFPGEETITAGINVRPYVQECIERLSKHYQLAIFTASDSLYANPVIDSIDPTGKFVTRLYRHHCVKTE